MCRLTPADECVIELFPIMKVVYGFICEIRAYERESRKPGDGDHVRDHRLFVWGEGCSLLVGLEYTRSAHPVNPG